jgi:hypothetical protein
MFQATSINERNVQVQQRWRLLFLTMTVLLILPVLIILVKSASTPYRVRYRSRFARSTIIGKYSSIALRAKIAQDYSSPISFVRPRR